MQPLKASLLLGSVCVAIFITSANLQGQSAQFSAALFNAMNSTSDDLATVCR
jgi:hypothetical protein